MPFGCFRASFIGVYRSLNCGLVFTFTSKILCKHSIYKHFSGLLLLDIVYIVFKQIIFTRNVTWALPIVTSSMYQAHLGILLIKCPHWVFLEAKEVVLMLLEAKIFFQWKICRYGIGMWTGYVFSSTGTSNLHKNLVNWYWQIG